MGVCVCVCVPESVPDCSTCVRRLRLRDSACVFACEGDQCVLCAARVRGSNFSFCVCAREIHVSQKQRPLRLCDREEN